MSVAGGPFKCPGEGIFADANDCNKYYQCIFGYSYHLFCPGGMFFNPEIANCDDPANVICTAITQMGTGTAIGHKFVWRFVKVNENLLNVTFSCLFVDIC